MSVRITIQGTPIDFPVSADSPNWAPAVTLFAQLVEEALNSAVGTFDISPQVLNIDASNPISNANVTNLSFSTTDVRAAFIRYSVSRFTSTTSAVECGEIRVVYNPDGPVSNKWNIEQNRTGDASISFTITDNGQVQYSTTALGGINHVGRLTYEARALQQDE
jgi:hypothetical protein